jgi:hypothetical protein
MRRYFVRVHRLWLLLAALAACATDPASFAEKYAAREDRAFALDYLQLLVDGHLDSAAAFIAPAIKSDTAVKVLAQAATLLRSARLDSLHVVGVNIRKGADRGERELNLTYEMPTRDHRWLLANVATRRTGAQVLVIGFSASSMNDQLETVHRFTLAGKTPLHYLWLVLATGIPLLTITVAVNVARTKRFPRRWLWTIIALLATPTFALNWSTGHAEIENSLVTLFGGSALRASSAAPWTISFALPLGALIAYFRLRRWNQTHPGPVAASASADGAA